MEYLLKHTIEVLSIVVSLTAIIGFIINQTKVSNMKSNCIATLRQDVDGIKESLKTLKVDAFIERMNQVKEQLQNGSSRFCEIEKGIGSVNETLAVLKDRFDGMTIRTTNHYTKLDKFEIDFRENLKEIEERLVKLEN